MLLGYNTNGFPHHRPAEAVALLAGIGYRSVAITVDHHCLDPYSPRLDEEVGRMRELLASLGLRCVVETGARFLLDPRAKHEPTLMTADPAGRARRVDFLRRCVDIAAALGADALSFWSGTLRDDAPEEGAFARLVEGCRAVLERAREKNVPLAFEPEPGMFIETMEQYARLLERAGWAAPTNQGDPTHEKRWAQPPPRGPLFGLTLDIGHLHCVEDEPIPAHVRRWKDRLVNVHIEDMQKGTHEHLMFGEGTIDFPPVLAALAEIGYAGGVHVELSRHGHAAPQAARQAFDFLSAALGRPGIP
ncbi:MAG: sugar phosphate isomerase/epimerase family protein [Planctomycetales bacterium]